MFKKLLEFITLKTVLLEKQLEIALRETSERDIGRQLDLETGRKFNEIINKYPISEDELLSISETVAKFVSITRKKSIDKYLFSDKELTIPKYISK